jgi:hypothetical protein
VEGHEHGDGTKTLNLGFFDNSVKPVAMLRHTIACQQRL